MAQRPLVSILTPAYKAERYIGQAIESVLAQTMPDWELIIVEDCSPDNTAQVVEQYLGDPRIKLIRNEQNIGAAASRNRALDVAQGEWITLLDADDWYEPQRLEQLLRFAEHNQVKAVLDLRRSHYEDTGRTEIARISPVYPNPTAPTAFSVYECAYGHIVEKPLMNRSVIQQQGIRYVLHLTLGEDYLFNLQYLYQVGSLWVIPEPLYNYRIHARSATQSLASDLGKIHALFRVALDLPEVRNDSRLRRALQRDYRRELAIQRVNAFHLALRHGRLSDAIRIYREAPGVLDLYPNLLKARIRYKLGLLKARD